MHSILLWWNDEVNRGIPSLEYNMLSVDGWCNDDNVTDTTDTFTLPFLSRGGGSAPGSVDLDGGFHPYPLDLFYPLLIPILDFLPQPLKLPTLVRRILGPPFLCLELLHSVYPPLVYISFT